MRFLSSNFFKKPEYLCGFILFSIFILLFIILTPLGAFESWIPEKFHQGYYSLINIDPADDTSFYAFLRSTAFDRDIDFTNETWYQKKDDGRLKRQGFIFAHYITPTGYTPSWTHGVGSSLFWAPFLWVGEKISRSYEIRGIRLKSDDEVMVPQTI